MRILMQTIALLSFLLINVSCAKRSNKPVESTVSLADIQAKRDLYLSLQNEIQDKDGWLDHSCDGLLFNSLAAYAGLDVNVYAAREPDGRWRRTPDFNHCKPGAGSKATISKDMYRGLMLYLWQQKDLASLAAIEAYGSLNNWIMGEAEDDESFWGRVVMTPSIILQLKDMIKLLTPGLSEIILARDDEYGTVILQTSFGAHLHVLNIYTRAHMYGGITDYEKAVLSEYTKFQPANALFEALRAKFTDGNYQRAINLLSDTRLHPADRLPTSADRCSEYIYQWEEQGLTNWKPCDEGKTHSGVDLTFVVKIMEE